MSYKCIVRKSQTDSRASSTAGCGSPELWPLSPSAIGGATGRGRAGVSPGPGHGHGHGGVEVGVTVTDSDSRGRCGAVCSGVTSSRFRMKRPGGMKFPCRGSAVQPHQGSLGLGLVPEIVLYYLCFSHGHKHQMWNLCCPYRGRINWGAIKKTRRAVSTHDDADNI